MKGTHEEIIKALKCLIGDEEECMGGEKDCQHCPYDQSVYDIRFNNEDHENEELLKDTIELLERYLPIDDMYREKCEEVNKLRDLVSGKFDPIKYVDIYNSLIEKESTMNAEPFQEHEHI